MTKTSIMTVQGIDIALTTINDEDYISLTDIIKAKDGDSLNCHDRCLSHSSIFIIHVYKYNILKSFPYGKS